MHSICDGLRDIITNIAACVWDQGVHSKPSLLAVGMKDLPVGQARVTGFISLHRNQTIANNTHFVDQNTNQITERTTGDILIGAFCAQ